MSNLIPRSFFLDDDFDNFFFPSGTGFGRNDMKCDIYEKDNSYHIEMDIPGFDKEDIKIEVDDGRLTIKAAKSTEAKEEEKNYIRRERSYGEYQRSFVLGDVNAEKIEAKVENGTLKIILPKKEVIDSKKIIEIQ